MSWKPRKGIVAKQKPIEPMQIIRGGVVTNSPQLARRSQAARLNAMEQARQEDVKSVALAQPHRQGSDDRALGSALGRLCRRLNWRDELYRAGEDYGEAIRAARQAEGFTVTGSHAHAFCGLSEMTEAERERLIRKRDDLDLMLMRLDERAPRLMERLCYDDEDIPLYREALAGDCLILLAQKLIGLKLFKMALDLGEDVC